MSLAPQWEPGVAIRTGLIAVPTAARDRPLVPELSHHGRGLSIKSGDGDRKDLRAGGPGHLALAAEVLGR